MSTDAAYFGIDFGTTNSSMAWYDPQKGEAKVILNSEGQQKTPSLVYFGEEEEILVDRPVEDKVELAEAPIRTSSSNTSRRELQVSGRVVEAKARAVEV